MIIKSFELDKIDLKNKNFFLLYGENQGLKNEIIEKKFKKNFDGKILNYEETELLSNKEDFFNSIFVKSFFENEKLIIVTRVTDKIKELITEIIEKNIEDIKIILNANILDKKSKLRSFFEKDKDIVCVPFYADNNQTLILIMSNFFRQRKIKISQESINLVVERSRGDRQNLNNELQKIQSFINNKDKIEINDLLKLTNLAENYNVSELIDSCLAKNQRKTINILNENNYTLDDCILIIRTFLIKAKRLHKIYGTSKDKKNLDDAITYFRPPIFWKDKEIIKQQLKNWSYDSIELLIYQINDTELLIKQNLNNSINILSNFILENTIKINN